MFHWLSNLFIGLKRLAENVHHLADTVGVVNSTIKERLELPHAPPPPVVSKDDGTRPLLPEEVDHTRNGILPPPAPEQPRKSRKITPTL